MCNKKGFVTFGKMYFTLMILLMTVCTFNSYSQWQADYRLTNSPYPSIASSNNMWCIAANGNNLHVVWFDNRNGSYEIYYKRSTDGGTSWEDDVRLTNNPNVSQAPAITVSGQNVHVAWNDNRDTSYDIFYKRSTDNGVTWGSDVRLRHALGGAYNPTICNSGSVLHLAWEDQRDNNSEIYYRRSTDGGTTWEPDVRLTNNFASSFLTHITSTGLYVHVIWADVRDGNGEIYYKRSTDGGTTWSADIRLTNHSGDKDYPSVSSNGTDVHVIWIDQRDANREVYYKGSTDNGVTWSIDTRLTNNSSISTIPSVASSGPFVHTVWSEERDGNPEVYYKRSTDRGFTWGTDTRLTNDPALSQHPSVAISGTSVHVVWDDGRDGNQEIYYKKDPTGNPTGITNIGSEIPKQFSLSQNYPNPFNPSTKIRFDIPAFAGNTYMRTVQVNVYDILGRQVTALVNQNMQPGKYEVEFDGSRLASGLYFYKLDAGDFTETKKMLMIK